MSDTLLTGVYVKSPLLRSPHCIINAGRNMPGKALTFTLKGKVEGPQDAELSSRLQRGIFSVGHQMSQLLLAGHHDFAMLQPAAIATAPAGVEVATGSSVVAGPSGACSLQQAGTVAAGASGEGAVGQQQVYLYYKCSPRKVGKKKKSGSSSDDYDGCEDAVEIAEGGGIVASKTLPLMTSSGAGSAIPAAGRHVSAQPSLY
jgi:hypothetical protein